MDRALDFGSSGCEFESRRGRLLSVPVIPHFLCFLFFDNMRRTRQLLYSEESLRLELLTTPIHQIHVSIESSPMLSEAINKVRADMERMMIKKIKPFYYLSTGYGTIAGTTNICLGFYDADERLRELNREYRGWGYSNEEITATIRHEVGHAFAYAYKNVSLARISICLQCQRALLLTRILTPIVTSCAPTRGAATL